MQLGNLTIGEADDMVLVNTSICCHLLELTKTFCNKYNVELFEDRTKLQEFADKSTYFSVSSAEAMNPIAIKETLWCLLWLSHKTSRSAVYLLSGCLPGTALVYLRQLTLASLHPLWITAGNLPSKVGMAIIQAVMVSERYKTEALCRHWSKY